VNVENPLLANGFVGSSVCGVGIRKLPSGSLKLAVLGPPG